MEKNLPVPYKSQHDPDSTKSNSDCGAASEAMVMEYLGRPTSTGEIIDFLKDYNSLNFTQLSAFAQKYGFTAEVRTGISFDELKGYIDQGLPVIVVGTYKYLTSRQDKAYESAHIMVVNGYRADNSVYVKDPDFWGNMRNDGNHNYTHEEFMNFWNNAPDSGNPQRTVFILRKPQATVDTSIIGQGKVVPDNGAWVRRSPQVRPETKVYALPKGTIVDIVGTEVGEIPQGTTNNMWFQVKYKGEILHMWSGGLDYKVDKAPQPSTPPINNNDAQTIAALKAENAQLKSDKEKATQVMKGVLNNLSNAAIMIIEASPQGSTKPEDLSNWEKVKSALGFK